MFEKQKPGSKYQPEKIRPLTGQEFKEGNLPGTDTYDDGLDHKDRLVAPGSTSTESGGTYMEDEGPQSKRYSREDDELASVDTAVSIVEDINRPLDDEDDAASRWLRENDPNYKR